MEWMGFMMKYLVSIIVSVFLFSVISVSESRAESTTIVKNNTENQRTIESFEIETFSETTNSEGINEISGSKKVNAITEINANEDSVSTIITSAEDYYDINGKFLKSLISVQKFNNDYVSGEATIEKSEKEISKPQTILNYSESKIVKEANDKKLTNENKLTIDKHLQKLIKNKKQFKSSKDQVQGFTKLDLKRIKDIVEKGKAKYQSNPNYAAKNYNISLNNSTVNTELNQNNSSFAVTASVIDNAGAFDNYYNYDGVTGNFTVQSLSGAKHQYIKYQGTTRNNTKNWNSYSAFKTNIDAYESYIKIKMESSNWSVVADWAFLVADAVIFVVGLGSGPAGWLAAMAAAYSAVNLLKDFTSVAYATTYRASLSKTAQQYLKNAQAKMYYTNWSNYTSSVVPGF